MPDRGGERTPKAVGQWSEHPAADVAAAVLLSIALGIIAQRTDLATAIEPTVRTALYSGLAQVAGLTFAASTFICTFVYQSANYLMSNIRQRHGAAIRRNWLVIIGAQIGVAVVALLAHVIDTASANVALALAGGAVVLIILLAIRSIWWLSKTLFIEDAAAERGHVSGYDKGLMVRKH